MPKSSSLVPLDALPHPTLVLSGGEMGPLVDQFNFPAQQIFPALEIGKRFLDFLPRKEQALWIEALHSQAAANVASLHCGAAQWFRLHSSKLECGRLLVIEASVSDSRQQSMLRTHRERCHVGGQNHENR